MPHPSERSFLDCDCDACLAERATTQTVKHWADTFDQEPSLVLPALRGALNCLSHEVDSMAHGHIRDHLLAVATLLATTVTTLSTYEAAYVALSSTRSE